MDHLSHPKEPASPNLSRLVHYLEETPYDWKGFHDFPARCGKEEFVQDLLNGVFEEQELDFNEYLPFLQSWLFFGTLHEVFSAFKIKVEPNDFIKTNTENGRKYVSSEALKSYAKLILIDFLNSLNEDRRHQSKLLGDCLLLVSRVLKFLLPSASNETPDSTDHPYYKNFSVARDGLDQFVKRGVVLLSVSLLLQWVQQICNSLSRIASSDIQYARFQVPFDLRILSYIFSKSSWCPAQVLRLIQGEVKQNSLETLLYVAQMSRRHFRHLHTQCNTARYLIESSATETPRFIHFCLGEDCGTFSWNCQGTMLQKIRTGAVLLVHVDPASRMKPFLCSLEKLAETDYIAISHVWWQGLRCAGSSGMHLCQIRALHKWIVSATNSARGDSTFWIDTLCFPVDPQAKRSSISRMRDIYQRASAVLVIDETLFTTTYNENCSVDALMRISYSPWTMRLWTLQESRLARDLLIQFENRAVSMEDILFTAVAQDQKRDTEMLDFIKSYCQNPPKSSHRINLKKLDENKQSFTSASNIVNAALESIHGYYLPPGMVYQHSASNIVEEVLFAARSRTTTKAEDEPVCLASLWNLDVRRILDVEPRRRMREVFSMLCHVPMEIIFSHQPRHDYPYGWLPTTFLQKVGQPWIEVGREVDFFGESEGTEDVQSLNGKITDKGLLGYAYGAVVYSCSYENTSGAWTFTSDGSSYGVEPNLETARESYMRDLNGERVLMIPEIAGVILHDILDVSFAGTWGIILDVDESIDPDAFYGRYICAIKILPFFRCEDIQAMEAKHKDQEPLKFAWGLCCIG